MAAFNFQTQKSSNGFPVGAENQIIDEQISQQIRDASPLKATFTKQDIERLLNTPDCRGVRFFLAPGENDSNILVGIGIGPLGRRLDDTSQGHFCLSCKHGETGAENHFDDEVKAGVSEVLQQNNSGAPTGFFKKYFSADMLRSLLLSREKLQIDISGITYEDDSITPDMYHTFAFSTLDANDEVSSNALLSMLPCPPNCGSGYDNTTSLLG